MGTYVDENQTFADPNCGASTDAYTSLRFQNSTYCRPKWENVSITCKPETNKLAKAIALDDELPNEFHAMQCTVPVGSELIKVSNTRNNENRFNTERCARNNDNAVTVGRKPDVTDSDLTSSTRYNSTELTMESRIRNNKSELINDNDKRDNRSTIFTEKNVKRNDSEYIMVSGTRNKPSSLTKEGSPYDLRYVTSRPKEKLVLSSFELDIDPVNFAYLRSDYQKSDCKMFSVYPIIDKQIDRSSSSQMNYEMIKNRDKEYSFSHFKKNTTCTCMYGKPTC